MTRPELRPTPPEEAVPQRLLAAAGAGVAGATGASVLVQLLVMIGWLDLPTIGSSLLFRVAIPAVCFVIGMTVAYLASGLDGGGGSGISSEMEDEEIAELLRRHQ